MRKQTQIVIRQYSPLSIVVVGDTKPIKDRLRNIGGRFNPRLRQPGTDKKVAGWVFSNRRRPLVEDACHLCKKDGLIDKVVLEMSPNLNSSNVESVNV